MVTCVVSRYGNFWENSSSLFDSSDNVGLEILWFSLNFEFNFSWSIVLLSAFTDDFVMACYLQCKNPFQHTAFRRGLFLIV